MCYLPPPVSLVPGNLHWISKKKGSGGDLGIRKNNKCSVAVPGYVNAATCVRGR